MPPPPFSIPARVEPLGPDDLAPLFPMELIRQEVSAEREIEIPEPVRDAYRLYRPSPLYRAHRLEKALDTPAHIYYKYEGVSPAGSHKPNTALAQAFYNKDEGVTPPGDRDRAPASGGAPSRSPAPTSGSRSRSTWSAPATTRSRTGGSSWRPTAREVVPSPSTETHYGRKVLAETPDSPGSLGIAISEAVEDAASRDDTKYSLGSVLNHVLLHQTVIGQEAIEQMEMAGEEPDVVIGCAGGGSNFAGLTFPFLGRNFREGANYRVIAVEPEAAPSLTRGVYAYDFGDTAQDDAARQDAHARPRLRPGADPRRRPALPRHVAAGEPAQGARLHRGAQRPPALDASRPASSSPGPRGSCRRPSRPTPSGSRSTRRSRREEAGEARVILFNLCGHGHFDLCAYERYLTGDARGLRVPGARRSRRRSPPCRPSDRRTRRGVSFHMPGIERVASGSERPAGATTCPSSRPVASRANPAQMIAGRGPLRIIK